MLDWNNNPFSSLIGWVMYVSVNDELRRKSFCYGHDIEGSKPLSQLWLALKRAVVLGGSDKKLCFRWLTSNIILSVSSWDAFPFATAPSGWLRGWGWNIGNIYATFVGKQYARIEGRLEEEDRRQRRVEKTSRWGGAKVAGSTSPLTKGKRGREICNHSLDTI